MMKRLIHVVIPFALVFCLLGSSPGQTSDISMGGQADLPSVSAVEDSVRRQFNRVQDYMVIVNVSVQMPGLRMPRKRIDLAFKQPDLIKVETTGFAVVPRTGMTMAPDEIFKNLSEPVLSGVETLNNRRHYILTSPVQPDSFFVDTGRGGAGNVSNPNVRVWIDSERWLITRLNLFADTTQLVSIQIEYDEIEPGIWLPEFTEFRFDLSSIAPAGGMSPPESMGDMGNSGETFSQMNPDSLGGLVTMEFRNYRVNTGLSDRFFKDSD